MVGLEEVLITAELESRPARAADHQAESRALLALSKVMADAPRQILERLVETAADLCRADAAGISLLEAGDGEEVFRWHAIAGRYASHLRGIATREFSPCGLTVNCGSPQLLRYPHCHFTYLERAEPRIVECLLIPFRVNGQPVGAIWLLSHEEDRKFDAEDVRVLTDLADFCAAALHAVHEVVPATIAATVAEKLIEAHPPVREAMERQAQATDRRVAAARREGERSAEMLLQNITDYAVMMLDEEGNITAWNEGAARMKGYTAAEIIGQHVSIFIRQKSSRSDGRRQSSRPHGRWIARR